MVFNVSIEMKIVLPKSLVNKTTLFGCVAFDETVLVLQTLILIRRRPLLMNRSPLANEVNHFTLKTESSKSPLHDNKRPVSIQPSLFHGSLSGDKRIRGHPIFL
jgi:hypothetical protein